MIQFLQLFIIMFGTLYIVKLITKWCKNNYGENYIEAERMVYFMLYQRHAYGETSTLESILDEMRAKAKADKYRYRGALINRALHRMVDDKYISMELEPNSDTYVYVLIRQMDRYGPMVAEWEETVYRGKKFLSRGWFNSTREYIETNVRLSIAVSIVNQLPTMAAQEVIAFMERADSEL